MLKLNASYSKKVPAEGEYSSQSYHCSVEVELSDKLEGHEIQAKIHANETELNVIMVAPVLMIALMRSTNATFAQNLASPTGVAVVTVGLAMFVGAYIWGQKIIAVG